MAIFIFAPNASKTSGIDYTIADQFISLPGPLWAFTGGPKEEITNLIIAKAIELHIDSDLLVRIAQCESGLRIDAKNTLSSASGLFQFLTSTFISQSLAYGLPIDDKNDPEIQIELAARMIADGKIGHWRASFQCWSK